jgi:methylated-DNA-[protein]-cysteine S-methyltransferase
MEIRYTCFETAWGWCGMVKGSAGILRIYLPEPDRTLLEDRIRSGYPLFSEEVPAEFAQEREALQSYFSGGNPAFSFQLDFSGATLFQKAVWKAVRKIPYGQVRTYQWIAKQIKNPLSMRAAGSALGRNPLPIVVPCHRVIREDGLLGGFSAPLGVEMKAALLKLEGVSLDHITLTPA